MTRDRIQWSPWLIGMMLTLVAVASPVAARTTVKMATLVPDGSIWDKALKEMGAQWQKDSGGEVALRIYAGGVAGDEPDVVRKMRIGQLHAAALTTAGLATIDPAFQIFQLPMVIDGYDELFAVLDGLRPALEKRLEARGYILLNWGHGGWVHLFSKQPVRVVDDLRKQKLFSWSGDDSMFQMWRTNGFQPVALAATDIMPSLQTGMIDALPTTPLAALSLQWFRQTPFMQDIGVAPLVGATVITKKAWAKIAPPHQAKIRAAAAAVEQRLETEVPDQDRRAVTQMTERGLEVVSVDAAAQAAWRRFAEQVVTSQRGTLETPELLEKMITLRDAHRAASAGASP